MTLNELNNKYSKLKHTKECLEQAMKKFEGTDNIENYLGYKSLQIAKECVNLELERFSNKDWK